MLSVLFLSHRRLFNLLQICTTGLQLVRMSQPRTCFASLMMNQEATRSAFTASSCRSEDFSSIQEYTEPAAVGPTQTPWGIWTGTYYAGKLNSGSSTTMPVPYFSGVTYFDSTSHFFWGDYSHTTLDPDGLKIWTIQEYAEILQGSSWPLNTFDFGTWISAITPF